MTIEGSPANPDMGAKETVNFDITFLGKDAVGIHSHDNDPMVITIGCNNWEIEHVLTGQWIYTYIFYWDSYERLLLDPYDLGAFQGSLVGVSSKQMHVKGYITLKIMF